MKTLSATMAMSTAQATPMRREPVTLVRIHASNVTAAMNRSWIRNPESRFIGK